MSDLKIHQPVSAADAVAAMREALGATGVEEVAWPEATGRILAEPIVTDRPSPAADVSAMDGYAVRLADVKAGRIDVAEVMLPGRRPGPMPIGLCVRIMTGAVVPPGADAVIKREDVEEHDDHVLLPPGIAATAHQNIRRCGENMGAGRPVLEAGSELTPAAVAAMVSFGYGRVRVHERLRVSIIVTGDELLGADDAVSPWQLRDSNGPALAAMIKAQAWIELVKVTHCPDDRDQLHATIAHAMSRSDAVLLTGGVSAGTHDFVPQTLRDNGCRLVFHKLSMRPGRPVLGAVGPGGQAVFGLPGNPLSVMVTARRIALPVMAHRAGRSAGRAASMVSLDEHDGRAIALWWYRPVRIIADGVASLADTRGSGDVPAAASTDGFVEIPPEGATTGPFPFYAWTGSIA
ncbi:MAG: molybdopterin molybdenumtransferase MoeA [Planctomycetes bacterium]|nr:molybdopterin molybdenumtransferase MoeA [Planctomycetota bacterium]